MMLTGNVNIADYSYSSDASWSQQGSSRTADTAAKLCRMKEESLFAVLSGWNGQVSSYFYIDVASSPTGTSHTTLSLYPAHSLHMSIEPILAESTDSTTSMHSHILSINLKLNFHLVFPAL